MPNRTFSFSHSGGFWKTRYTFFSTCYATLNNIMFGFSDGLKQQLLWSHNTGTTNTRFYGAAAEGSGISVSFNDDPSANKVFKSVSIEGTANIGGAAALIVNNSTTAFQAKASPMIAFEDKGGILYGKVQGLNISSSSNLKAVGQVLGVGGSGATAYLTMNYFSGGQNNLSATSKFLFYYQGEFYNNLLLNTEVDMDQNFADFEEIVLSGSFGVNEFLVLNYSSTGVAAVDAAQFNALQDQPAPSPVILYSISNETVNGDQLRGQIADGIFALGAADYELYALNLEYENTTYDHSKRAMTAGSRRNRSRKKT